MGAVRPDRDTFLRLLEHHPVVPVWREVLADTQTPVAAFLRLDPQPNAFLLESVEGGERWARYSFIGGDAFAIVRARDGRVAVEGDPPVRPEPDEPPLAYVRRLLEACKAPRFEGLPPLHGGAVGFMGYDCVRQLERLPDVPEDDLGLPDLALLLTRTMVVFDHLLQKAFVITNVAGGGDASVAYDDAIARCDEIVERLGSPLGAAAIELSEVDPAPASSPVSDEEYARWVEKSREHIYSGDIFQVVPSRRFEAELYVPALDAYRVL